VRKSTSFYLDINPTRVSNTSVVDMSVHTLYYYRLIQGMWGQVEQSTERSLMTSQEITQISSSRSFFSLTCLIYGAVMRRLQKKIKNRGKFHAMLFFHLCSNPSTAKLVKFFRTHLSQTHLLLDHLMETITGKPGSDQYTER
jgi:hypothetical protein